MADVAIMRVESANEMSATPLDNKAAEGGDDPASCRVVTSSRGAMERSHLVAGLVEVKRELVAKHADLLAQLNETTKDINAVSRIIAKCDKDAAYIPVFPPRGYKAYFAPGELLSLISGVLKKMPDGATVKEIAESIGQTQTGAGRELPKLLGDSIRDALYRMLARKAVVKSKRSDNRVIWLLAKRGAVQDQAAEAKTEPPAPSGNVTPLRR